MPDVQSSLTQAVADQFMRTPEFQMVLQKVEDRARDGVTKEALKNATALFTLAVAGGAIGGTIFKGGRGTVLAVLLAIWAGAQIAGVPVTDMLLGRKTNPQVPR